MSRPAIDWRRSRAAARASTAFASTISTGFAFAGRRTERTMSRLPITTKKAAAKRPVAAESGKRPANGWNIARKPVHPGEMLREEFLVPLGLSANKLAIELRVSATRISEIVNERWGVTADTALRLARYFGMTPE